MRQESLIRQESLEKQTVRARSHHPSSSGLNLSFFCFGMFGYPIVFFWASQRIATKLRTQLTRELF